MARQSKLERELEALDRLAEAPTTDAGARLRVALCGPNGLAAAKAARIAVRLGYDGLVPHLAECFRRHLADGAKTDKGCHAKTAAVEALNAFDVDETDLFLAGVRHVQMEASWGGPEDTASDLRAQSAAALARLGHRDLFLILGDLLMGDPLRGPRIAAAKILADLPRQDSELLLRARLLAGDPDTSVLCECLSGLMRIAPGRSLDFVGRFLRSTDAALAEEAALALGESRLPAAFDLLRRCWEEEPGVEPRRRLVLPIGLLRLPEARAFLTGIAKRNPPPLSTAAREALRLYARDPDGESAGGD